MPQFEVDEELAAVIERLAKPKPFEHISFNDALWRVVRRIEPGEAPRARIGSLDQLMADVKQRQAGPKKAPTPSAQEWASSVPELKNRWGLHSWKAICDLLKIETAGDSARRKLKTWVRLEHPSWPAVPDID
ncbi:MAG TPA: hypothetical protein VGJ20_13150 [Xanthobacteraceae bacterium]|jgi:hypothetical protein